MRLLLLTLYYPPLNTIAALRLKAYESYLTSQGHTIDVITRYYDEEQQKGQSMFLGSEPAKKFTNSYIKEGNVIYTNFKSDSDKKSTSEKLPPLIRGIYNYWHVDVFHYGWVNPVLEAFEKELKTNTYDFIVASYGPPVSMLLANKLSEKYNIPFVIDFRDSFIDEQDSFYQLMMKRIVQEKNLKNAAGLIFATKGMQDFFNKNASAVLKRIPTEIVYNGVDEQDQHPLSDESDIAVVKRFQELKEKSSFLLLHTGTLYAGQNSSFFLTAVEEYNKAFQKKGIVVFVGLAENKSDTQFKYSFVHLLPKVKHSTAMYLQKEASALLLPVWDGRYTGFSGKTLEYLFSENFIITSPNPQSDLKEFLAFSPNVHIPQDKKDFKAIMETIFTKGHVRKPLNEKEKLYRSYWIKKMIAFLSGLK